MNLSRKNKKNVNKKSSKKLITKPKKKLSKKSIIKSRKKITRKLRKKYNKNKLKFNKINGGTLTPRISLTPRRVLSRISQSPRAAISRILQSSSSLSRTRNSIDPDIGPAVGTIVAAQVPDANVKTVTDLRNNEVLLKNALETTIEYMKNVVMELNNMYKKLINSPTPAEAGTNLNNAIAAWNSAYQEGIEISRLLDIIISNGMVTNNHAGVVQQANDVYDALLLINLTMNTVYNSVNKFLNNKSYYNPDLVLFDETGKVLLNEAIYKTKLLVNNLINTVDKLNVLREDVNTMISNQVEPARGIEVPMGVRMGVPES